MFFFYERDGDREMFRCENVVPLLFIFVATYDSLLGEEAGGFRAAGVHQWRLVHE